jgi:hypothetical protein
LAIFLRFDIYSILEYNNIEGIAKIKVPQPTISNQISVTSSPKKLEKFPFVLENLYKLIGNKPVIQFIIKFLVQGLLEFFLMPFRRRRDYML